ncbi:DUF742 domain-containing protein, partial [Streptomyces hirsutus]|uniref:DUF742 domain-containing protein n=1 Tax=Streptomyces hirsutus TaxID=35620 RepID=UPI0033EAADE3
MTDDDHRYDDDHPHDRTHPHDDHWYEDETGLMVRPYAVTRGRTRPSGGPTITLLSQVSAVESGLAQPGVDHARTRLLDLVPAPLGGGAEPGGGHRVGTHRQHP